MSIDTTNIKALHDPTVQRQVFEMRHGSHQVNVPYISEIAPNLWQGGCPSPRDTGNGTTPRIYLPRNCVHMVSLYLGPGFYKGWEQLASLLRIVAVDDESQNMSFVEGAAHWVAACRQTGPVLVHCQAGLNRSSLVTARALMLDGMTAEAAIGLIREKRSPAALCNTAFEAHLLSL